MFGCSRTVHFWFFFHSQNYAHEQSAKKCERYNFAYRDKARKKPRVVAFGAERVKIYDYVTSPVR